MSRRTPTTRSGASPRINNLSRRGARIGLLVSITVAGFRLRCAFWALAWWHRRHADQAITKAGSIRRWARRMATRRISWIDHRTSAMVVVPGFLGACGLRPAADHGQDGEGQHHQRDMPMPAMPGAGLVVRQAQLGLGGLERVLDRPAPPLDGHQGLDRRAVGTPGREEGQARVSAGCAGSAGRVSTGSRPEPDPPPRRGSVGQFQVGPVVKARSLAARAGRKTHPG